jgi:WD40 repeat protein/tetratricopeptide (TPR) repeat protein/tRNA A-37 threonylcarbamoyl transferase component Bud32
MNTPANREVAIFSAALGLDPSQRAAYLDEACAGDPALRQQIESLLRAHEEAITFLESPMRPTVAAPTAFEGSDPPKPLGGAPAETAGDRIGRYKLLQPIGEGGCGVVYMAEQEEPVRRRVALKVIKLGMDTKQVVARFEAERQALAMMDHANIAKVFDAGATEAGRPYFVMELVRGIKITEYCDQNSLSTRQRLELFTQVCHGIQHAHQKGIIHRDIKPSNILVTENDGVAVPKVIDFGIAKATQGRLTDQTLFTAFEQLIGTPAYMSPEQAVMTSLDVDTRSDTYSLGVLLYELLTGRTPFDAKELMASGVEEMRRTIREREPPRPSTRLSSMVKEELTTTAKRRQMEPVKLIHTVRGDLDWIVMKCLEKDRSRRYDTPNGLAMDVQHYLVDEPVVARPPGSLYRFQKLVRRNKLAFTAAGAISTVLVVGAVISTWEAFRAKRAERDKGRLLLQAQQASETAKRQEGLARKSAEEAHRQQVLASEQELLARRRFYAAQINLANRAVEAGQLGRALELLETQRPKAASEDLRTFEWYYLWGVCNARLTRTLQANKEPVNAVAISPDDKTLATASLDSTIRLWDMLSGREGMTLKVPAGNSVHTVAFAPDGKTVAGGYWDGLVRLWDPATGRLRATLPGQHGWVRALAFSPDGSLLVCGGDDGLIKRIDLTTLSERTPLVAQKGPVMSLAFSKDGRRLAVAYGWAQVKIWDLVDGVEQPKLWATKVCTTLAFSPDGALLAGGGWDAESLQLWDTSTGQPRATLRGQSPPIHTVAWLPDGRGLVSCASDRTVRLWRMPPTNRAVSESQVIGEHLDSVLCLAVSADGGTVATGANDGSVKVWNIGHRREPGDAPVTTLFQLGGGSTDGALASLLFPPDGQTLVGVLEEGTVQRNLISDQEDPILPGAGGRGVLSPDGRLLATGDRTGTLKLWDRAQGRLVAWTKAHPSEVSALVFSPDGRMIVTCGFNDTVLKAWAATVPLNLVWGTDTKGPNFSALAFSPDGKTIAAMLKNWRVDFFDASTGRQNYGFQVERGYVEVWTMTFSPDGRLLATGSDAGAVSLWDVETGRLHATLPGHTGAIHALAFSPDGRTIATGSEDQTVRLWDVVTGQERLTLKGFQSGVRAVSFSTNGNTLVAGTTDATVRLWTARRDPESMAYRQAELNTDATNYNSQAWTLATHPDALKRDGPGAVRLAERAVAATDRKNPEFLDTLAAAYAEKGEFTKAINVQKEAIALLQTDWARQDYASRLELYEHNSPYRDRRTLAQAETELRRQMAQARQLGTNTVSGQVSRLGVVLHHLADVLCERDALAEARSLAEEACALYERHADWPENERDHAGRVLDHVLWHQQDFTALEPLVRKNLSRARQWATNGPAGENSWLATVLYELASVQRKRKVLPEARSLAEEAAAMCGRHPDWPTWVREEATQELEAVLIEVKDYPALEAIETEQVRTLRPRLAPDDPELARAIGPLVGTLLQEKKFREAEVLARECLSIREKRIPDEWRTFNARSMLGGSLFGQNQLDEAEPLLLSGYEGMEQRKDKIPPESQRLLAEAKERLDKFFAATGRPRPSTQSNQAQSPTQPLPPEAPDAQSLRASGLVHAQHGRFKEAADEFARVIELRPDDHEVWHWQAVTLVQMGELEAYRALRETAVQRFKDTTDPNTAERIAKDFLILPGAGRELETAAKMAQTAANAPTNHPDVAWFRFAKGLADYRQGQFSAAVDGLHGVLSDPAHDLTRDAEAFLLLAMAEGQLQHTQDAQAALGNGLTIINTRLPKLQTGDLGGAWVDWIIAHALLNEVTSLSPEFVTQTLNSSAPVSNLQGQQDQAAKDLREAFEAILKPGGQDLGKLPPILRELAETVHSQGKPQEAEKCYEQAIEVADQRLGETNLVLGELLHDYGVFLFFREHKPSAAAAQYLKSLPIRRAVQDDNLVWTLRDLGNAVHLTAGPKEAEPYLREALELYHRLHREEHLGASARPAIELADVLYQQQRLPESEQAFREALAACAKCQALATDEYAGAVRSLLEVLKAENKPAGAEALCRDVLAQQRATFTNENPIVTVTLCCLAESLAAQGKRPEAAASALEAMQKCHASLAHYEALASNPDHHFVCWGFALAYEGLGSLLQQSGHLQEAEIGYRDTQLLWRKLAAGSDSEDDRFHLAVNQDALANLLRETGRAKESLQSYREAAAIWLELAAEFNLEDRRMHLGCTDENIGQLLRQAGHYGEAAKAYRQALAVWKRLVADSDKDMYRNHLAGTETALAATLQAEASRASK